MSAFRPHTIACMLMPLLLTACASSPPQPDADALTIPAGDPPKKAIVERSEPVRVEMTGVAPFLYPHHEDNDGRIESNLTVGLENLLSYRASWSIEAGDVLATETSVNTMRPAPTRFGGQQVGQNVSLQLPELAGAPMALAVSSEVESNWLLGGSTQLHRERADLSWAPGPAKVSVQWAGSATLFNDRVALLCNLQSSVRLPVSQNSGRSEALRLSGRSCYVPHDGTPYDGSAAQAWSLSYVWSGLKRQSEATVYVIEPRWATESELQAVRPAYELGLSHERNLGALSASGLVSLRQGPAIDGIEPRDPAEDYVRGHQGDWSANASLTWQLPSEASISANWATGIDRLWFTPGGGRSSDRFGLALNLSRWVESLMPASSPLLAMNWNWSEVRPLDADVTEYYSLKLDIALMF